MDVEKDRHVDFADAQSDFEAYRDMKQIHSAIQFEKDKKKKKTSSPHSDLSAFC